MTTSIKGTAAFEYTDLIRNRPQIFIFKFALWVVTIGLGVYLADCQSWYMQGIGLIFVALMFAHGIELEHQALHGTGTGNRWLDMKLGFILGLPLLISVSHYRDRHLHHHQHVGTDDDSEFFQFSKENNERPLRLFSNLLMLPHWVRVAQLVWASWTGGDIGRVYNRSNERHIRIDYAIFGLIVLAAVVVFGFFHPINAILLLAFPFAACLHTILELPEHCGCTKSASVFENTRTVRAGWFVTWFTNGNNFHVEHHLAPALRPEALRAFHERIASQIVHQNDSYLNLTQEFLIRKAHYARR
jgi:fatty acid desaturase